MRLLAVIAEAHAVKANRLRELSRRNRVLLLRHLGALREQLLDPLQPSDRLQDQRRHHG